MAFRNPNDLILINGVALPPPVRDYEIVSSQAVDSGRNANGSVVGQLVGRRLWKINNLHWKGLTGEEWATITSLLSGFFVDVTFTNSYNQRMTLRMYPGDHTGKVFQINGTSYDIYEDCKVNLIDCGL